MIKNVINILSWDFRGSFDFGQRGTKVRTTTFVTLIKGDTTVYIGFLLYISKIAIEKNIFQQLYMNINMNRVRRPPLKMRKNEICYLFISQYFKLGIFCDILTLFMGSSHSHLPIKIGLYFRNYLVSVLLSFNTPHKSENVYFRIVIKLGYNTF